MKTIKSEAVVYQTKTGAIELRGDVAHETMWATQAQMAKVFNVNSQAITKHIKNIYSEGELKKETTCSKMEQVQLEGKRKVTRTVDSYNLDVIIAVGYRINSVTGTMFRQWATKVLRQHITQGYTINKTRIKQNYEVFIKTVDDVKALLPASLSESTSILELIKTFAQTWVSLDAYDKSNLPAIGATKRQVEFTAEELKQGIIELKQQLMQQNLASDLFAAERNKDAIAGIVGNVFQSFGGVDVYATVEEKAAHLLYFMIKNHPFTDGNKRSAAFCFVWFLNKTKLLDQRKITPEALTALTLLVAESNPKDKDKLIGLVLLLLEKN